MPDDEYEPDPYDREDAQQYLYGLIGFEYGFSPDAPDSLYADQYVHDTFGQIMYNDELSSDQRDDLREQLYVYLYDEYGLDFDDLWSWEDFREWYDSV